MVRLELEFVLMYWYREIEAEGLRQKESGEDDEACSDGSLHDWSEGSKPPEMLLYEVIKGKEEGARTLC